MNKKRIPWNKGKTDIYTEETKQKMSIAKLGIKLSEEIKKKMSESHLGKKYSEETKQKLSKLNKGINNPNFGKKHTKRTVAKISEASRGNKNGNWHGGRITNERGYIFVYTPDHPQCNYKGYIREHRIVMEKYLGRYLTPNEVVHHINGIEDDNKIENLELFANHGEHLTWHHRN